MLLLKIRGLNRTIFSLPVSFNSINTFFTYAEVKDSIVRLLTRRKLSDSHIYRSSCTDNKFLVLFLI